MGYKDEKKKEALRLDEGTLREAGIGQNGSGVGVGCVCGVRVSVIMTT